MVPKERFTHPVDASQRRMPVLPKKDQRIRIVIDTDAGCEIDDQYAIALALFMPEKFKIEGFTAVHWGSPDTIGKTVDEINLVLDKAGMSGKYPVLPGGPPLPWDDFAEESEAADFIIEKALKSPKDDPLYVLAIGCGTNVASAYMKEPKIAEHIVLVYHMRGTWPINSQNANVMMDNRAARQIFHSNMPLVMYDTGTYIRCPKAESEKILKPYGPLGEYLHSIRVNASSPGCRSESKGFFDLGDIVLLADPESSEMEVADIPMLRNNGYYVFGKKDMGKGLRVTHTCRRKCFRMLHEKLAEAFPK